MIYWNLIMKIYCLDREYCGYQKIYNNLIEQEKELFLKCPECNSLAMRVQNSFFYNVYDSNSSLESLIHEFNLPKHTKSN